MEFVLSSFFVTYLLYHNNFSKDCSDKNDCCDKELESQLQAYYSSKTELQINLAKESFVGYIYKIICGIVYLVDDLDNPSIIYAIPLCKILSYQPQ